MKNFIYITLAFVFLLACKPGIPKTLIQPDKMAQVLHDIHVVDASINTMSNMDTTRILAASYYNAVYKRHGVDSILYNRSMDYYLKHPDILEKIYLDVTTSLTKERVVIARIDSLDGVKAAKAAKLKLKADSAKKADSVKKVLMLKKTKLKADSLRKIRISPKQRLKKRRDSIRKANAIITRLKKAKP